MVLLKLSKGKKRVYEASRASTSSSSLSPPPPEDMPVKKKPKRAETRPCPVCDESIPLRLLARHAELESQRVEEIIRNVGSTDILVDDLEEGPSSRSRRSAIKARKSMSRPNNTDTLEQAGKAIHLIKRRRKTRHAKLREMAKEEEEGYRGRDAWSREIGGGEIVCPVCAATVKGDQDVLDAHVDACLANEGLRMEEERQRELELRRVSEEGAWEEVLDVDGTGGHVGDVRGTGFHTRDRNEQDVDDEVDVDGDDLAVFGEVQFTEGDILTPIDTSRPPVEEDVEVEIEGDSEDEAQREQMTLRDLVAESKVIQRRSPEESVETLKARMEEVMGVGDADRMELAILTARKRGDKGSLIIALENKVKQLESTQVLSSTSLLCRICLDPYDEPTVSTGCWHTCCRECWLRCLGSTKLCPICKRITGATDLRRVFL